VNKSLKYQQRIRELAIENLGGRCWYCFSRQQLEIDHIYEDGWRERRKGHSRSHVQRAAKGDTIGLQLLCHHCHIRKTVVSNWVRANRELKEMDARYAQIALGMD